MGEALALLRAISQGLLGYIPGWILSTFYSDEKLKGRVRILSPGVGPHLYVTPGKSLTIEAIELAVFNGLPFDIKLERLRGLTISLESRQLVAEFEKFTGTAIAHASIAALSLPRRDLTDNQAALVREYPSGCPILHLQGRADFKAAFKMFTVEVSVDTRAYRYETPGGGVGSHRGT